MDSKGKADSGADGEDANNNNDNNAAGSSSAGGTPGRRVTLGGYIGGGGVGALTMGGLGGGAPSAASAAASSSFGGNPFPGADRRGSLGMDAIFGRRASGFGLDAFDSNWGMGASNNNPFGRRGSMDSTTAVLDAAIMDLTRRRLSMAMGGGGGGDNGMNASLNDPLHLMGFGFGGPQPPSGGGTGSGAVNNASGNPSPAAMATVAATNAVQTINARQEQLQQQQRELERRQKDLELQRQQLLTAMEERRRIMQNMQQKISTDDGPSGGGGGGVDAPATGGGTPTNNAAQAFAARNSLLGSLGAGGFSANPSSGGRAPGGSSGGGGAHSAAEWQFLQNLGAIRRGSMGGGMPFHDVARRGSLDLLGALAGVTERSAMPSYPGSNANILQQQIQEVSRRLSMAGGSSAADMNASHNNLEASMTAMTHSANSNGPFSMMDHPIPLSMSPDKEWLTPLHCFVRRHCVEIFTATEQDVATPSKGKRRPIHVGQVGIRCPHCYQEHEDDSIKSRERGSVYYPTTISSIYNATMNLLQRHLHHCTAVPPEIMQRYETLKADDARSGTSKKYWIESAQSVGLVDTPTGIRFSAARPPPLPTIGAQSKKAGGFNASAVADEDFYNSQSNALADLSQRSTTSGGDQMDRSHESFKDDSSAAAPGSTAVERAATVQPGESIPDAEQSMANSAPLVAPDDEPYATAFSFHLLSQMQPCVFTEADRLGKRKGLPPGFPGLACRHCFGGYGSGRFFPSSIKTLSDTSKTLNVLHNHMMRCRKCPTEVRKTLERLRVTHDEERAKMKFGSQKAFFARIWDRLHFKDPNVSSKRKFEPPNRNNSQGPPMAGMSAGNFAAAAAQFQQQNAFLEAAGLQAGFGGGFPGGFSRLPPGFGGMPSGMPGNMQEFFAMQQLAGFGSPGMQSGGGANMEGSRNKRAKTDGFNAEV